VAWEVLSSLYLNDSVSCLTNLPLKPKPDLSGPTLFNPALYLFRLRLHVHSGFKLSNIFQSLSAVTR
jgi:hypothetical protein